MNKLKASYKLMLTYEKTLMLVYIIGIIIIGVFNIFFVKKSSIDNLLTIISIGITMEYVSKIGLLNEMYRNFYFSRWILFKTNLIIILQKTLIISVMLEIVALISSSLNKDFKLTFMGTNLNRNEFLSYIIMFFGLMVAILMIFALTTLISYLFKVKIIILIVLVIINEISCMCIFHTVESNEHLITMVIIAIISAIILFYISWVILKKKTQFPV